MILGAFSISLNVENLKISKEFYENLGFESIAGDIKDNYLIMKNGETVIGLFQGMFDNNILTFNPGWNQDCSVLSQRQDIREIKNILQSKNIDILNESIENDKGPGSFSIVDPDGNHILFDQHI
jgi:predicted lactoylglutathione lyase